MSSGLISLPKVSSVWSSGSYRTAPYAALIPKGDDSSGSHDPSVNRYMGLSCCPVRMILGLHPSIWEIHHSRAHSSFDSINGLLRLLWRPR